MVWTRIVGIIVGSLFVIGTIIAIILLRKRMGEVIYIPDNAPKCYNWTRTKFTEGYSEGLVLKDEPRKNGTHFIEYYPTDPDQGEDKPKQRKQRLIVKDEFIKRYSAGELSSRRNIMIFLPRTALDLPESMRNTELGNFLTMEGQKAWLIKTIKPMIPAGDEAIGELVKYSARGQISRDQIKKIDELWKDIDKITMNRTNAGNETRKV